MPVQHFLPILAVRHDQVPVKVQNPAYNKNTRETEPYYIDDPKGRTEIAERVVVEIPGRGSRTITVGRGRYGMQAGQKIVVEEMVAERGDKQVIVYAIGGIRTPVRYAVLPVFAESARRFEIRDAERNWYNVSTEGVRDEDDEEGLQRLRRPEHQPGSDIAYTARSIAQQGFTDVLVKLALDGHNFAAEPVHTIPLAVAVPIDGPADMPCLVAQIKDPDRQREIGESRVEYYSPNGFAVHQVTQFDFNRLPERVLEEAFVAWPELYDRMLTMQVPDRSLANLAKPMPAEPEENDEPALPA